MKSGRFEYVAPESLAEAVLLLERLGEDAKVLAGGQSLVPLMALRLARPTALVDLGGLVDLRYVTEGDVLGIGAMTTHRSIEHNEFVKRTCPMVAEAMGHVGHVAIRNRGTVGGSMAHADPAAEWPTLAVALEAEVDVIGGQGRRTIPARDLFLGYLTTALEPDEIITELRLKLPPRGSGSVFMELSRRHGDFGLVGVACVLTPSDGRIGAARLALMSVGGVPIRVEHAESLLIGQTPSEELLQEVGAAVNEAIEPASDVHGSESFRRSVATVLAKRTIEAAWKRAGEGAVSG